MFDLESIKNMTWKQREELLPEIKKVADNAEKALKIATISNRQALLNIEQAIKEAIVNNVFIEPIDGPVTDAEIDIHKKVLEAYHWFHAYQCFSFDDYCVEIGYTEYPYRDCYAVLIQSLNYEGERQVYLIGITLDYMNKIIESFELSPLKIDSQSFLSWPGMDS